MSQEKIVNEAFDELDDPPYSARWNNTSLLLLFALLLLIGGGVVFWYTAVRPPVNDSAEVGFARDMMDHHNQAVEMAMILYDRTEDGNMQTLAQDIALTQQGQIGMMLGWLDLWGHTPGSSGPSMAWMGMPMEGLMPGMATQEDINRLRELSGVEAEALFLQLMIPHHRGGVLMAQGLLERSNEPAVRNLAQSIVDSQTAEIEYMQQLLQERGYPPVPNEPVMNHGGTQDTNP